MSKPPNGPRPQEEQIPATSGSIDPSDRWLSEHAKALTKDHTAIASSDAWGRLLDFKIETEDSMLVPLKRDLCYIVNANVVFYKAARRSSRKKSEWRQIAPSIKHIHVKSRTSEHASSGIEAIYFYWMNYCLSLMRISQIYTQVLGNNKRDIPEFMSDIFSIAQLPMLSASTVRNLCKWSEIEWEGEWSIGKLVGQNYELNKYPRLYKRAETHALNLFLESAHSIKQSDNHTDNIC
ncbi:hypothetical protein [Methylosinus sp. PW1]|uniref:hypothetical protein n=1 Tax=Methylosinus sp. PW1 TaxID=107636 RepID=UPI0012EC97E9|nr:hypothetical protein [Methylosinus sp. PW1]